MTESKKHFPVWPDHLPPLTDEDGEVRELTEGDLQYFRPAMEVIPEIVEAFEKMRGERGPQKAPVKERIGLRLDPNVVAHFRRTGPGWQGRINAVLMDYVKAEEK